ncbi:MAG: anti-sigma factor antagonist [Acidimicrobiaceae bacterium]|jgi:anti-sigma B factor antagonist|nr:anti-sigma factor antagonist [Acidimicrobiaceae bacterium]
MTDFALFDVTIKYDGRTASTHPSTVTVAGEVDLVTAPRLRQALVEILEAGEADAVVDLSAVEFIDASGIGVLVWAAHEANDRGGRLTLRQPSPAVRLVLGLVELNGALHIEA